MRDWRHLICLLLAGALLGAVAIPASGSAGPAPAAAAKKKCKKAKKGAAASKKKGCKKPKKKPARLSITPTTANYGFILGRSSKTLPFTVTNVGPSPSGIPDVVVQDTSTYGGEPRQAFFLASSNCEVSLPPAGTCTIEVQFEPPLDGMIGKGTLNVSSSPGGLVSAQLTGNS